MMYQTNPVGVELFFVQIVSAGDVNVYALQYVH